MITWFTVPEIWCATDGRKDRQTDGQKKWHIEVGAPPIYMVLLESMTMKKEKNYKETFCWFVFATENFKSIYFESIDCYVLLIQEVIQTVARVTQWVKVLHVQSRLREPTSLPSPKLPSGRKSNQMQWLTLD